jgi:hypothetical protein
MKGAAESLSVESIGPCVPPDPMQHDIGPRREGSSPSRALGSPPAGAAFAWAASPAVPG